MRALETRASPIRELLQLVSFDLAEEQYVLPILTASLRPSWSPTRASIRGKTEPVRPRRLPSEPA
jgi:hypothetical protein